MGRGGVGIIPTGSMATLHDLHLHLMLRYLIFTCTFIDGVGWGGLKPKDVLVNFCAT